MIKINKSVFTEEELAQYNALIAKATVDTDADPEQEMMDFTTDDAPVETGADNGVEKSAMSPEIAAALLRMENLAKSVEMKEFTDIAKKYAPLGEKEDELAKKLYDMSKSDEGIYKSYVEILDKSLDLVEKSGIFTEIGKSARGGADGSAEAKINTIANEIMKSDATISHAEAVAKAWTDHPELVAEYEATYRG